MREDKSLVTLSLERALGAGLQQHASDTLEEIDRAFSKEIKIPRRPCQVERHSLSEEETS